MKKDQKFSNKYTKRSEGDLLIHGTTFGVIDRLFFSNWSYLIWACKPQKYVSITCGARLNKTNVNIGDPQMILSHQTHINYAYNHWYSGRLLWSTPNAEG